MDSRRANRRGTRKNDERRKKLVPVVYYDGWTSQKISDVLRPSESRNILILVQQPRKILKFQANPMKRIGYGAEKWRELLGFPLGMPGISRFFEAAGLKSRYFEIERHV